MNAKQIRIACCSVVATSEVSADEVVYIAPSPEQDEVALIRARAKARGTVQRVLGIEVAW